MDSGLAFASHQKSAHADFWHSEIGRSPE